MLQLIDKQNMVDFLMAGEMFVVCKMYYVCKLWGVQTPLQ